MNTSDLDTQDVDGRRRRRHSMAFKAAVIAECRRPGVSIAAVALRHRLNANLLRRWVVMANDDERAQGAVVPEARTVESSPRSELEGPQFVPVSVVHPVVKDPQLQIDIRRGALDIRVSWPVSAAAQCGAWLREVLK